MYSCSSFNERIIFHVVFLPLSREVFTYFVFCLPVKCSRNRVLIKFVQNRLSLKLKTYLLIFWPDVLNHFVRNVSFEIHQMVMTLTRLTANEMLLKIANAQNQNISFCSNRSFIGSNP